MKRWQKILIGIAIFLTARFVSDSFLSGWIALCICLATWDIIEFKILKNKHP